MTKAVFDQTNDKAVFGFWVYILTDCVLFACLFATFIVLRTNMFGGNVATKDLFSLPYILTETVILLTSSFTCGLALLAAHRNNKQQVVFWYAVTFLLGVAFLTMEVTEFRHLAAEGHSWRSNGFLSSFFTLVGTHGLHITAGLIWMFILVWQVAKTDISNLYLKRLTMLSLFWHFLDIVWIFIFSIVYLLGAV